MALPVPLDYLPYTFGVFIAIILVVIVWFFRFRPVMQYPLPKEEDLGYAKIWLGSLGRFNEGTLTTARNYFAENFGKAITNSAPDKQTALVKFRDKTLDERWLLAHRCGRSKIVYLFDANPLEPKYCHREDRGTGRPVRQIGPVQDCGSVGSFGGFEFIFVKLDKTTVQFSSEERTLNQTLCYGLQHIQDAGANLEEIKFLKDRVVTVEDHNHQQAQKIAELSAKCEELEDIASQKRLTQNETIMVSRGLGPKARAWFGDFKQYVAAGLGYLIIAPFVISHYDPQAAPPTTTYLTLAITVACFFVLPVFKKIAQTIGKWRQ